MKAVIFVVNNTYLFLILTLVTQLTFGKEVQCQLLFRNADPVSKALIAFQNGEQDTTSLRQEIKFVIKTKELNPYIQKLEKIFGQQMKNRDQAAAGTKNITSTKYMTVVKYISKGKLLSAKMRFRKYFARNNADLDWKNLQVSEDLKWQSWLELKIQHPDHDNVVIKPRLKMYDSDIQWLTTTHFSDHVQGITRRLKELNPSKHDVVDRFIHYLVQLNNTPALRVESLFAKTDYERVSYSIQFKGPKDKKSFDVQITLDENIRLTRLRDKQKYNVYEQDETVVEVKVPVQYAKLTPTDIENIPELLAVKDFISWLTQKHESRYPINKGKMSKIEKHHDLDRSLDYEYNN